MRKKTKFGIGQIKHQTPQWAKNAFRAFFYITSIATLGLDTFADIPMDVKFMITKYVIQGNLFAHGLSKLFGVETK